MPRRLFATPLTDSSEEPSVNLTPLIDVVFVVLIAFILIAPLLNYESMELAQGSQNSLHSLPVTKQSSIAISVKADNGITINQQPVTLETLPEQLQQLAKTFPGAIPQLFHDQRASFGTYCKVKNAVERAGYGHLDIVLTPNE